MSYSKDYLSDILVRIAYHSSGIEGNTISLPETVSIILENTLPSNHQSIREFYEIENHRQTFELLLHTIEQQRLLDVSFIKNIHASLTDRLQHDKGQFKATQNAIVGAEFKTATPQETPFLMQQWAENTEHRLENVTDETNILQILADTHIQFERIHPFSDGNGRTGRLLLMYLSMKYLHIPIIIIKEKRAHYIECLAKQDVDCLVEIFTDSLINEKERMAQFGLK